MWHDGEGQVEGPVEKNSERFWAVEGLLGCPHNIER